MSDDDIIASEIKVDEDEIADMEDEVNEEVDADEKSAPEGATPKDAKKIVALREAFASVKRPDAADEYIVDGRVDVPNLGKYDKSVFMRYADILMYGSLQKARMANRVS